MMKMSTTRTALERGTKGASLVLLGLIVASCGSDVESSGAAAGTATESGPESESTKGTIDEESSDRLEEAQGELEDLIDSGTLGSGGGVITIEGIDYTFDAAACYAADDNFTASGPGVDPDGVPFWASISYGVESREEALDAGLPEQSVDAMFGESDTLETFAVEVEIGKSDMFESAPDGMPDFALDIIGGSGFGEADYAIDGDTLSGTGTVTDYNGIALDYSVAAPVTYSATCK